MSKSFFYGIINSCNLLILTLQIWLVQFPKHLVIYTHFISIFVLYSGKQISTYVSFGTFMSYFMYKLGLFHIMFSVLNDALSNSEFYHHHWRFGKLLNIIIKNCFFSFILIGIYNFLNLGYFIFLV